MLWPSLNQCRTFRELIQPTIAACTVDVRDNALQQDLSQAVMDSVQTAKGRGAQITVCGAKGKMANQRHSITMAYPGLRNASHHFISFYVILEFRIGQPLTGLHCLHHVPCHMTSGCAPRVVRTHLTPLNGPRHCAADEHLSHVWHPVISQQLHEHIDLIELDWTGICVVLPSLNVACCMPAAFH